MPSDESRENISNSAIYHDDLKTQNLEKFIKIRKELIKDLGNPEYYCKNKNPVTVKYVFDKTCPYAQNNGRVIEHYYVWWKNHPKDPVRYNEEILHVNGDVSDNRIENLQKISKKLHKKVKRDAA